MRMCACRVSAAWCCISVCVPQALRSFSDPAVVTGAWRQIPVLAYACTLRFAPPDFRDIAAQLAAEGHFRVSELDCGHDAMIDVPDDVARLLLSCADAVHALRPQPADSATGEMLS